MYGTRILGLLFAFREGRVSLGIWGLAVRWADWGSGRRRGDSSCPGIYELEGAARLHFFRSEGNLDLLENRCCVGAAEAEAVGHGAGHGDSLVSGMMA